MVNGSGDIQTLQVHGSKSESVIQPGIQFKKRYALSARVVLKSLKQSLSSAVSVLNVSGLNILCNETLNTAAL